MAAHIALSSMKRRLQNFEVSYKFNGRGTGDSAGDSTGTGHSIRHLSDVTLQDLSEDTTEAQWYEPWNFILTRVVGRISKDLTVAPQCRLARIHIAEDDNNRAFL